MVDSNNILLDNSQHSNPKCPFHMIKSFSNPTIQERPRSNSHISFNCHPEFVPKPKPKPTDVNPSPMTLCRRITSTSSNDCISYPENNNEFSNSEEIQPFSPMEYELNTVNELRKGMIKNKE